MSNTPNLDELRELSKRLSVLLAEAHPGLITWQLALTGVLEKLAEVTPYPDAMRDLHAAEELYEDAIAKARRP